MYFNTIQTTRSIVFMTLFSTSVTNTKRPKNLFQKSYLTQNFSVFANYHNFALCSKDGQAYENATFNACNDYWHDNGQKGADYCFDCRKVRGVLSMLVNGADDDVCLDYGERRQIWWTNHGL